MKIKKPKYYVVWKGFKTGIFNTWAECEQQIKGYDSAQYKSFESLTLAEKAFSEMPEKHIYPQKKTIINNTLLSESIGKPILDSISVDAACIAMKGIMEYQGVYTKNKKLLFKQGPFDDATNNIGEFLALVHALAYCKKHQINWPIYSDSMTAIAWVRKKKAATKQELTTKNTEVFQMIQRAEEWLQNNTIDNKILKWETEFWGEIPADFGRK